MDGGDINGLMSSADGRTMAADQLPQLAGRPGPSGANH
jgi:hypothetical protein